MFDVLYNNTSDIKPERHLTDTHGTNQVNFWILHVFGYRLPHVTVICTKKSTAWSGRSIQTTIAIASSNRRAKRTTP